MCEPLFSVLLPSRNRLELLRLALNSVAIQDFSNLEVIISDNASDQKYLDFWSDCHQLDIRYLRSEEPISVTENWNRAIEAARGEYIIMLGDDDALTPGLLVRLSDLIQRFRRPDVLYLGAYYYAYPGVFASKPEGYFCSVKNS